MARILIISHETTLSDRLKPILESMGHSVLGTAEKTVEALTRIVAETPDMAFIDLAFGAGHDGAQFAQIALDRDHTKLIFMINSTNKATAKRARATRPDAYLVCPFSRTSVEQSITVALDPTRTPVLPAILQELLENDRAQVWSKLPEHVLLEVRAYIRSNLDKEITLKALAKITSMSESNFSRRFKSSLGITPYQFVLHERLEEAKHLLRNMDMSLVHIAAATGFSSQSHFSTVFKKSTRLTPLQYRQQ